jgi:CubicO group peptidase (beta-lactamase class C family)
VISSGTFERASWSKRNIEDRTSSSRREKIPGKGGQGMDKGTRISAGQWLMVAIFLLTWSPRLLASPETQAREGERERIARVEAGLLPAILLEGRPVEKEVLHTRMEELSVPALSVAVFEDYQVRWARGYGVLELESGEKTTRDTLFQAGSISKLPAALLALTLANKGSLSLDQPVSDLLRSWKLPDSEAGGREPVTVRHLLTHSAGLNAFAFPLHQRGKPRPELLQLLKDGGEWGVPAIQRVAPPGRESAYSNPGFGVLQQLLVDVSGRSFQDLAQSRIFGPLGMTSSSYAGDPPPELFARAATGYLRGGEAVEGKVGIVVPAAAGGLWSTPSDLSRFLIAVFHAARGQDGAIIPAQLAQGMVSRQIDDQALGLKVAGQGKSLRVFHAGGLPGFAAFVVGYPDSGKGAAVMATGPGMKLLLEVLRSIAVEYEWPGYVEYRSVVDLSPEIFARYTGQYEFIRPAGLKMPIYSRDGRFYRGSMEMIPVSETLFVIPKAGDEIEFLLDDNGQATGFTYGAPGGSKTRARKLPEEQ